MYYGFKVVKLKIFSFLTKMNAYFNCNIYSDKTDLLISDKV